MLIFLLIIAYLSASPFNITQLLLNNHQIYILSFLSLGFMMVFYAGEYDLSIGSTFALCLVIIGKASNNQFSLLLILLLVIILIVSIAWINAYFSKNIPSLLITFIIMYIIRGAVFIITEGLPLYPEHGNNTLSRFDWGVIRAVPYPALILMLMTLVLWVYFNRSAHAKNLIAVGIDQTKTRFLGINPYSYKLAAFIFSASMALFSSVFYYTSIYTVSPNTGIVYGFEALAVVIISNGGLKPVLPSPLLVVFTASLITLINQYSSILNFSSEVVNLIIGVFVTISLSIGAFNKTIPDR